VEVKTKEGENHLLTLLALKNHLLIPEFCTFCGLLNIDIFLLGINQVKTPVE
jgi:hypothetical protein